MEKRTYLLVVPPDTLPETFLLFSQSIPSNNLGFVSSTSTTIDIDIGNRTFTITQSPSLLNSTRSEGTTGAVLWQITPLIASWLASHPSFLTTHAILTPASTIIELGCGISGLIGLTLAPFVSNYILTDLPYIRKLLQQNIDANPPIPSKSRSRPRLSSPSHPIFIPLDWETTSSSSLLPHLPTHPSSPSSISLIIICDCVYNEHLIPPLISTITDICSLRPPDSHPTYALIAQQLRSDSVFEAFLTALIEKLDVWRVSDDELSEEMREGGGYVVHIACLKTD